MWFNEAIERPSVAAHFNKPFSGDDSPEFCQGKVTEVLKAQGKARAPVSAVLPEVDFVAPAAASEDLSAQH